MTRKLKIMKASAGSGKTYSLARKYISLLLQNPDRYAYRHILAVTFTNKATDEMKSRILKELHVLATDPCKSDYYDYFVPAVIPGMNELQQKAKRVLSVAEAIISAINPSFPPDKYRRNLEMWLTVTLRG